MWHNLFPKGQLKCKPAISLRLYLDLQRQLFICWNKSLTYGQAYLQIDTYAPKTDPKSWFQLFNPRKVATLSHFC